MTTQWDDTHRLRFSRTNLGAANIAGFNTPRRGSEGRCTGCDWRYRYNVAPSAGGEKHVTAEFIRYHAAQAADEGSTT